MKSVDPNQLWIDYLGTQVGVRVTPEYCVALTRREQEWSPEGKHHPLPVPAEDLLPLGQPPATPSALRVAFLAYEVEHPGSDLRAVLTGLQPFATACASHFQPASQPVQADPRVRIAEIQHRLRDLDAEMAALHSELSELLHPLLAPSRRKKGKL
jgi:hypothetical protein